VLVALACSFAHVAWAGDRETVEAPRWEAGLGAGAVVFPVYRGAATSETWPLPIPYFVYRGSVLRADRGGVNAVFVDEPHVRIDLSGNASPPVRSSRAAVRHGMADLRPTVEFGPSLEVTLWQPADLRTRIGLQVPVRAAVTLERSPRAIGYSGGVYLNVDRADAFGWPGWALGVRVGPGVQSRAYNAYFYDVGAQDVAPGRPAYAARGGYAGVGATLSLSKRFERTWLGAFVRYDSLSGAAFTGSPLVESRRYVAAGIGFVWVLKASRDRVRVDPIRLERRPDQADSG
jgi:outer membrane scaffolding protein for murein synthesis (MipA/OmpV family)